MNKTIVITGANRGIGLSLSKLYSASGYRVVAVCRSGSNELRSLEGVEVVEGIDVTNHSNIEKLRSYLSNSQINLLINNAGVLRTESLGAINYSALEEQFAVNALGPLRVTESLLPNFSPSAKVAMITSRMGSVDDNTSGGRYGYRMSKAALNIAAKSLSLDLASRGVSVAIIHPGLVGTDMIGGYGDVTPDQAARNIAQRIDELHVGNSGTFWHANGEILPW